MGSNSAPDVWKRSIYFWCVVLLEMRVFNSTFAMDENAYNGEFYLYSLMLTLKSTLIVHRSREPSI
jgi:hypothetical protein